MNYDRDKVVFRAKRMVKLIEVLENKKERLGFTADDTFSYARAYYQLLMNTFDLKKIMEAKVKLNCKLKIIILHFPTLAKIVTLAKWKMDGVKALIAR